MLKAVLDRVGPLALRLKDRAHYFHYFQDLAIWGGSKNDTTPGFGQLSAISDAACAS